MRSDTRANLWFLLIFVALSLPGGVILFRKKLHSTARPMSAPDVVERRLPYMTPGPTPPGYARDVPPATWTFLARLAREQGIPGGAVMFNTGPHGERLPIVSVNQDWQLVGVQQSDNTLHIDVVAWDASDWVAAIHHPSASIEFRQGERVTPARIVTTALIPVDAATKQALMNAGAIKPPAAVLWIKIDVTPAPDVTNGGLLAFEPVGNLGNSEYTMKIPPIHAGLRP